MKNIVSFCSFYKYCVLLVCWTLFPAALEAADTDIISQLNFKQISTLNGLPTDEVQKIFQDREGFIWFATRYGLCKYDGYQVTVYKSNLYAPGLLTSNNIYCLADDYDGNLWIGTQEGLNVLNKKTGEIRQYTYPAIPNNAVSCLSVTKDNKVWVGTDSGLCRYVPQKDSFVVYGDNMDDGAFTISAIKSLLEDADGDLWVGTWSGGLFRHSLKEDKFYAYPRINERNSAHVIYQDADHKIWVGGWDCGLFLLNHSKDMEKVSYTRYVHKVGDETSLSDNIVYDIVEDVHTHTLWIGTRAGLSIMKRETPGQFINYKSRHSSYYISCDEINSLLRDRANNIWLGSIGGGALMVSTELPPFTSHSLNLVEDDVPTTSVRAVYADSEKNLWLGAGSYGLARKDYETGKLAFNSRIPEFSDISGVPTVNSIIQRRNGELWFGTYDGGILIYKKGEKVRVLTELNTPYLYSSCVSALCEDSRGNCWVGCRGGMGVSLAGGGHYRFSALPFDGGDFVDWYHIKDIVEDMDGSIWVATANCGIIHITGNVQHPETLKYSNYSYRNGQLAINSVLCLHIDRSGRLWAGTEGGGLYLYDREKGTFCEKNREYNIPSDMIGSIEEDGQGCLWMGTNIGLVRLNVPADEAYSNVRVYTTADGLQDNFFIAHASCSRGGELFFGGNKGYNSFFPETLKDGNEEVPYLITDIKIFNRSFASIKPETRERISSVMPSFTHKIELPYEYNNFSIEFASLTFKNPDLNRYAYQLVGFDKDWQYTDASRRFAYYNNLESGTYKFRLKATNENGIWSGEIRELEVVVLPPFWATWWAYVIYILIAAALIFSILRTAKNRMQLRNELHLREMEKAKLEELNHVKLQFFTNITHELLTPLTIISATVDELKMQVPGHDDIYTVLGSNISRLIRLLQQILEFRKAETGNLKLRVSPGDIAAFVKNEAESFLPLVKKRKIHFSVLCNPESIIGYFDTDKLDKILYNLLSNAAKYNKDGGYIQITLSYAKDRDFIQLHVKDNGSGIPKEKQKMLFKRFYEGNYRKFNTIGTGIGLSLTKDLVELHGGEIRVESEENQGTEFIVTLPIDRSYFKEEQIEEEAVLPIQKTVTYSEEETETVSAGKPKTHTVLVVEDNEELLQLMVKLLQREYNVHTAENGQEAVTVLDNEDIDLVVSDVMMPVMDGIEFCRYVKNKLELSHIPIILLTAKNKEEDRAEAYEVGADAFISKPFNLAVLHARIRNLLKYRERKAHDFKNQLVFEVKELNYTSIDEDFMQRAIACVNRHLEDCEFDQPQFVDEMGTSKSTLYKKLKSLTGLNTSAFIRNIRLKAACRIMEEKGSAVRISDLAYAVGFNDPKYFSACFKKEFGMLPTEYLERFT
ncbi:two-component regulator propeller domain-containing protein [Bacteroides sp. GD17]|uniref:hybrid sensor histidine kinase/response regulator transcription factor n=1 Tax=Bacteroides sp. GD17 TaxID=3139826 RepID=UPI00313B7DB8